MHSTDEAAEDMPDMQDRTFAVTGAGSGIGAGLTPRLVDLGADVVAMVRLDATNPELEAHVADRADRPALLPIHVADTHSVREAAKVARTVSEVGLERYAELFAGTLGSRR